MAEYKYNAKKVAYDTKFVRDHYDTITIKAPKGFRDNVKKAAEKDGKSMNVWIKDVIEDAINNKEAAN